MTKLNNPVPELTPLINEITSKLPDSAIQELNEMLNSIKPWTKEQRDRFWDTGEMPDG